MIPIENNVSFFETWVSKNGAQVAQNETWQITVIALVFSGKVGESYDNCLLSVQHEMPNMVTRPVIVMIVGTIWLICRNVVFVKYGC